MRTASIKKGTIRALAASTDPGKRSRVFDHGVDLEADAGHRGIILDGTRECSADAR
jgi:hypothetical protein